MWKIIWPLILIVTSNTMYNICTKSTPSNANAFGSLLITYITAAAITAVFFFYNTDIANTTLELSKLNWASIALGICIVGLELGYIFLYRAGANVSSASLIANPVPSLQGPCDRSLKSEVPCGSCLNWT